MRGSVCVVWGGVVVVWWGCGSVCVGAVWWGGRVGGLGTRIGLPACLAHPACPHHLLPLVMSVLSPMNWVAFITRLQKGKCACVVCACVGWIQVSRRVGRHVPAVR